MNPLSRRQFLASSSVLVGGLALDFAAPAAFASSGMRFDEYRKHDATALAALVRSGQVSAAELLELAIARTEQVNPAINAVVLKHYDLARASLKNLKPEGPFAGVPFLLKDLGVSMADTVTTQGSRFFRDARNASDDPFVSNARQAGLVIFGKTNTPEFGSSPSTEGTLFGATHNPWAPKHSAGGSSGGAAAAVAAGIVPVAHASDGGGSIRIPSSACGLFGLKPSTGLVPLGPAGSSSVGVISAQHVVARSVRDSAALLDALAKRNPGGEYERQAGEGSYLDQVKREPGKLRIALMHDPLLPFPVSASCRAAVDAAARHCQALGHDVVEATPPIDMKAAMAAGGTINCLKVSDRITAYEKLLGRPVRQDELEPVNFELLAWGRRITPEQRQQAIAGLDQLRQQMAQFMSRYDLILSPTIVEEPPLLGVLDMNLPLDKFGPLATRDSVFTTLFNFTGQPAMSVPLHWSDSGLPVGVMFAGRFGEERTLIRLAAQLEQAHPWFDRLPPV